MDTHERDRISERELEAWRRRVALVETLLGERIDEQERRSARWSYQREQGVGDRTERNYLKRHRDCGPLALLSRHRGPKTPSLRIHDEALRERILALIEESPRRTAPQLRRIISREEEHREAIEAISERTIYRFLRDRGLNQKQRSAKATDGDRRSFHQFQASASMELVQGDARDGIWLPDAETGKVRKTYLFAWGDDYSRRILAARYFFNEKLPCMEQTFKTMVLRWGIPKKCYLDNGKVYTSDQFAFVLAELAWFQALFLHHDHRKVSKYGTVKLEGNAYRTTAPSGSPVQIRYDLFDVRKVWRFEGGRSVETLGVHKLNNEIAVSIPEEQQRSAPEISEAAGAYFSALRERQAHIRAQANRPRYDKLAGEQQP